jgi:anti-anti-sigma factor
MALQQGELTITVRRLGTTVEIVVMGEVDIGTVPALHECVARSLRERPETAVIDLRLCTFIDSQGIHALLTARRRVEAAGATLVVIRPTGAADRVFTLCGLGAVFPRHADRDRRTAARGRIRPGPRSVSAG